MVPAVSCRCLASKYYGSPQHDHVGNLNPGSVFYAARFQRNARNIRKISRLHKVRIFMVLAMSFLTKERDFRDLLQ